MGIYHHLRRRLAGVALTASVLCVAGWGAYGNNVRAADSFYSGQTINLSGVPGTLIRYEYLTGAPLGATAYRVLYRSTGIHGEPIAVSGVVVIPPDTAPAGGRPIVAWAHPTTGVISRCAPSEARFVFQSMMGLRTMVRHGYIVAATDYAGLGTQGPHPYLVGASEARAVLDAVRAARQIPDAGAGDRFTVWGHSQGGQAALFTGMLASSYAPELHLLGVAVAAPATDLKALLRDDADTDGGRNVTAMTLWSWQRVYGAPMDRLVATSARPAVDALSNECIESPIDMVERHYSQRPLQTQFLSAPDITTIEPWKSLLEANIAGALPSAIPVFIAQGTADRLVLPRVTRAYALKLCDAGSPVQYVDLPGVGHGLAASYSALQAVQWMTDRFNNQKPPDTCPTLSTSQQGTSP